MTREEFAKHEKICKDAWKEMAENGGNKPDNLHNYINNCPACSISHFTSKALGYSTRQWPQNCSLCPITLWRTEAKKHLKYGAVCQEGVNRYYATWMNNGYDREAALKISKLKWKYLKVYESIPSLLD